MRRYRNGLGHQCKACKYKLDIRQRNLEITPYKFIRTLYNQARNRVKNMKNPPAFDLTLEDWLDIYHKQEGMCAISGIKMIYTYTEPSSNENRTWSITNPYNISPDQIVAAKGYTKDNLQFVCGGVNFMKGKFSNEIFMGFIHKIHFKSLSAV